MRKLKVGDIYYWFNPYADRGEADRFCVVTISNPGKGFIGEYDSWAEFGYYSGRDVFYPNRVILLTCLASEIKAGRLHYIGRL